MSDEMSVKAICRSSHGYFIFYHDFEAFQAQGHILILKDRNKLLRLFTSAETAPDVINLGERFAARFTQDTAVMRHL